MVEEQTITLAEGLVELQLLARNARLRQVRKEKGLTQKELSLITGIPVDTIGQIENLRFIPRQEVMEEISSALKKPADFLFPSELLEAIEGGVFHERKAQLKAKQLITLTEAKRLGYRPALLTSGEEVAKGAERNLLKDQIKEVLTTLPPRMQRVLTLRFGLDGGGERTCKEIGQEFNVTGGWIQQIEHEALRRLRHPSRSRKLKAFLD